MSRVLMTVVAALLFEGAGGVAARADVTKATVAEFERWVSAVDGHRPGMIDRSVFAIWETTVDQRLELDRGMPLFVSVLTGKHVRFTSIAQQQLADLARRHQGEDFNVFLERAAVLHSDAAIARRRAPIHAPDEREPNRRIDRKSPLFPAGTLLLEDDGEFRGQQGLDWNWTFARSLLTLVAPSPAAIPFVGDWYHATAADMFRRHAYGDATAHLEQAAAVLPDDVRIVFDRACLAEFNGLPVSQQLLTDEDLIALRARTGSRGLTGARLSAAARLSGLRPPEIVNSDAERLFRRVLQIDRSTVEARVRLARLLMLRDRAAEAMNELATALDSRPDPVVEFYAHLFAGRAARVLGRLDVAAGHYRAAQVLFPEAQSALLGASQVALLQADQSGALSPIQTLSRMDAGRRSSADPWWEYGIGIGRNADALLQALWATVPPQRAGQKIE
jgi:tetratricopeptide (TPR) repeat protein